MKIGFIGLGNLGMAISRRLIECGHKLVVYNRTKEKCNQLEPDQIVNSPKEVQANANIIFLCLFDSDAVSQILTGEGGLLEGDLHETILIDLTTNHFNDAIRFHQLVDSKGGQYIEAPVLGSVIPASKGTLTVLVSGREDAFQVVEPFLKDIGKNIFFLKEPGLATKMKLVNNLVLGTFMAVIAEAVALGETIGIEREIVLDILSAGAGDSLVLKAKKEKLLHQDFSTHFSNALIFKDLKCLQDLTYDLKSPLLTGSIVKELYGMAIKRGLAAQDFSAIYKLFQ